MSNKKSNNKDVNEFKNPTFFNAMKNAIRGCSLAIKNERNLLPVFSTSTPSIVCFAT